MNIKKTWNKCLKKNANNNNNKIRKKNTKNKTEKLQHFQFPVLYVYEICGGKYVVCKITV